MKPIHYLFLLFIAVLPTSQTLATHLTGAEIYWEKISEDTFKLKLRAYRDCNGISFTSQNLTVLSKCGSSTVTLTKGNTYEITPTCADQCTQCGTVTCSYKYGFEYTDFTGLLITTSLRKSGCCEVILSFTRCCRNSAITTGAASNNFYIESKLNICISGDNSSPVFNQDPISIICRGRDVVYNLSASDTDKDSTSQELSDSLVYSFTSPKIGSTTFTTWQGRYAYDMPLYFLGFPKTSLPFPRGFRFDSVTGELSFRPMASEVSVMAIKVEEFRNGIKIGEVTRDLQLVVTLCPNNVPPVITGINSNNNLNRSFNINLCKAKETCFYVNISDRDLTDTLYYSYTSNIPGMTNLGLTKLINGDSIKICFTPDSSTPSGQYQINLAIEDDACPIPGKSSVQITVNIDNTDKGNFYLQSQKQGCDRYYSFAKNDKYSITDSVYWYINGKFSAATLARPNLLQVKTKGQYIVMAEVQNCEKTRLYDTIRVANDPLSITVDNSFDATICQGDSVFVAHKIISPIPMESYAISEIYGDFANTSISTLAISTNTDSTESNSSFYFHYKKTITKPILFGLRLDAQNTAGCDLREMIYIRVNPHTTKNTLDTLEHCENTDSQFVLPPTDSISFWTGDQVKNDTFFFTRKNKPYAQPIVYTSRNDSVCYSDTLTFLVPASKKTLWQSDTALCLASSPISFQAVGNGQWKGDLTVDPNDDRKASFDPLKEGKFTLHYEKTVAQIENCELSGSFTINVTKKANPILIPDTTLCLHADNILLESQGQGTWYGPDIENDTEFNPSVTGSYSIVFDPADAQACLKKDSITVIVVENTNQISIIDTFSACENDGTEQLLIGNTKNGSWKGLGAISTTSILKFQPTDYQYGHYNFVYTDRDETYNCPISDTTVVEIIQLPKINISIIPDKVELGQNLKITNSGNPNYQYEWIINGSSEGESNDFEPEVIMDSLGIFDIIVIATDPRTSCSDTIVLYEAIEVIDPSSIEESHFSNLIDLYPNPSSDQITIENHGNQAIHFQLYDLSGKTVKSIMLKSGHTTIDLSELAKGFYQAQFSLGNSRWMEKVVKK